MSEQRETKQGFEQWAILELFGHNVMAGFVSEETIAGGALLRIDVPAIDDTHPAFTKYYGHSAIYAMTPTTEAHAREAAAQIRVRPVTLYILPEPAQQRARLPMRSGDDDFDADAEYARRRDSLDDDDDDDEHKTEEELHASYSSDDDDNDVVSDPVPF